MVEFMTVRDVFAIPKPGDSQESSDGWKGFQERIRKEVKGLKTAAMPDLAATIRELLEVPIHHIFLTSWKKTNVLQNLLEESQESPEALVNLELGDHTINSQHRPHIEVRIKNTPIKKIEFTLRLVFTLKGFVLKIQNGAIREMRTGKCEVRGTLEYQGLTIAEKKLAPINLPASIPLEGAKAVRQPDTNSVRQPERNALRQPHEKVVDQPEKNVAREPERVVKSDESEEREQLVI
jgi:hypothetical protein